MTSDDAGVDKAPGPEGRWMRTVGTASERTLAWAFELKVDLVETGAGRIEGRINDAILDLLTWADERAVSDHIAPAQDLAA